MDKKNIEGGLGLHPEIDKSSGFCYGVIKAIDRAEEYIKGAERLYSLGPIVHNFKEVKRLKGLGIEVIDHNNLKEMNDSVVLIRAHGEPPSTYKMAKENRITLIDCTCPVVLKLQERVIKGYHKIKEQGGTLVIFGKKLHAEVEGLLGQIDNDAVIVESRADLDLLDYSRPIALYSQTTKDPAEYNKIIEEIGNRLEAIGSDRESLTAHNTICREVASRHPKIRAFAATKDVVVCVSGKESSNGKIFHEICLESNPRSYKIEGADEIERSWFRQGDKVGICGATSTPSWLLEEVSRHIEAL
ncbi:MAG: 4-hydroxy-3-methylbut-2-enyl diphosphate reductase [Bacteroidales bacterium]